ncbi:MAG: HAD family hydrolase [Dongiaceae bacterium]
MGSRIKAITFDLWDTIVHDDSDEPKRRDQGLRTKKAERRRLLWAALDRQNPIAETAVSLAYDVGDAAFNRVWHDQHVTWTIAERLQVILKGLGRALPEEEFARLVREHEEMEIRIRPDLVPGIAEALAALHGRYRTCVVSDAIVSPGRCLRQLLESYGLARHFDGFVFSDEVGHSKPHRAMFEEAARQMGVALTEIVHIGDRDHNDVKGPQTLGMRAILFTATRPADKDHTSADAICERHADLPAIVDRLAAG